MEKIIIVNNIEITITFEFENMMYVFRMSLLQNTLKLRTLKFRLLKKYT